MPRQKEILGKGHRRGGWQPFEQARAWAHKLNLRNEHEWRKYVADKMPHLPPRPDDIPTKPSEVYRLEGWAGFGDWLGTGRVASQKREFRPFDEARAYVHTLGIPTQAAWKQYAKTGQLPVDVPANPGLVYGDEFAGYRDWLGEASTKRRKSRFLTFSEARKFARKLGLQTHRDWVEYTRSGKLPSNIPADPAQAYEGMGWQSMGDWLGSGNVATQKRKYLSFSEARDFVRSLGLRNSDQWREHVRSGALPPNIPHAPEDVYKSRWRGMGDWLGTGNLPASKRSFLPFEDARALVQRQRFKNQRQFFAWKNRPDNIPAAPHKAYAESGWLGYADFLGTDGGDESERRKPARKRIEREAPRTIESTQGFIDWESASEPRGLKRVGAALPDVIDWESASEPRGLKRVGAALPDVIDWESV